MVVREGAMNVSRQMILLEEARAIIDRTLTPLVLQAERIAAGEAVGRVLAADQFACLDLPPFNKSAMDGYALPGDEPRLRYRVLQTVAAGSVPVARLQAGTAVKVMTGAPVPPGAGRVARLEVVRVEGDSIEILEHDRETHICPQGEDVRRGDLVLPRGARVTAADVGNLTSTGLVEVDVARQLRLAIFSTGDEIADDPAQLRPGMIMDSNGPMLAALADRWGMNVIRRARVGDDRRATAAAIASALCEADLVVLSGGVSVGDFDFVGPALADAGLNVHFQSVAVKPGKPTTYASASTKAAFGLPGNPVAVFLTFHLLVLWAAARLANTPWPVRTLRLPLATEFRRRNTERQEYWPCRLNDQGQLEPLEFHGTAHLAALSGADGLMAIPIGCCQVALGERVEFLPVGRLFG